MSARHTQSAARKGKARAVSPRSPTPSTSTATGASSPPVGGFLEDVSRFAVVTPCGDSYEVKTTMTAVHTSYEGNEVSPTSIESTTTSTDKVVFRTVLTPAGTVQKILDALQQATTAAVDINTGTVDQGDHDAMIISRPSTPDPPVRIADRAAVDRFMRSYYAKEFVRRTLEEISARVAATAAADDDAENLPCSDIEMSGPASTSNTPHRGVASSTASNINHSATTTNAARFVAIADGAASNVVGAAAVVNIAGAVGAAAASNVAGAAGAADSSNVAGAPGADTASNIVGAAAPAGPPIAGPSSRPVVANSGTALAVDPPPPYTEQTAQPPAANPAAAHPPAVNPTAARPAAAQGSRSGLASGHSRRRHTRLASAAASAAASSARELHAGTACCPIIID